MLARHQTKPGHQLTRILKAGDVADLGHDGRGDGRVDAPQGAQGIDHWREMPAGNRVFDSIVQSCHAGFNLVDCALQFFKRELLVPVWKPAQFSQPASRFVQYLPFRYRNP